MVTRRILLIHQLCHLLPQQIKNRYGNIGSPRQIKLNDCFGIERIRVVLLQTEVRQGGFTWYQGVTSIELGDMGTGTGSSKRVAVTEDLEEAYPYLFHKGDLIFDNEIYTPADASKCK